MILTRPLLLVLAFLARILRRPALALVAAVALLTLGSPAYAAGGDVVTTTIPVPLILQGIIAVVLPIIVGLVTTRVTSSHTKALLLLALSIVSSGVTEFAAAYGDHPFDLGVWLISAILTFGSGAGLHFGLYKPTGVSAKAQAAFTKAA